MQTNLHLSGMEQEIISRGFALSTQLPELLRAQTRLHMEGRKALKGSFNFGFSEHSL